MYTADIIAKWFLARNKFDYDIGVADELISDFKLQELLYYAQGCTLALTDKVLFSDEIQAWKNIPVIPAVYYTYKSSDRNGIVFEESFNKPLVDDKTNSILETVYHEFGQYSAWKLQDMIHKETSWTETPINMAINTDSIKKYFQENYIKGKTAVDKK